MRSLIRKVLRYATVSVISTTISLTILGVLVGTRTVTAGWANVIATAVGTVPSFELNRRWVWGKTGRRSVLTEVGPFWVLSFAGLVLSTISVSVTAGWVDARFGGAARTVAAQAASLASFGVLWVAQFVVLDRLLFAAGPVVPELRTSSAGPALREGDATAAAGAPGSAVMSLAATSPRSAA